jgi:hypothetical protein
MRSSMLSVCILVAAAQPLAAQFYDLERDRLPVAELQGMARFHTGDDPDGKLGWARPGFDDASWPLLSIDADWGRQGYAGYSGFAWYRFRLALPAPHRPIALYIENVRTSYEVYADGVRIGVFGGIPPNAEVLSASRRIFVLPENPGSEPRTVTIAIRVWHSPRAVKFIGGGIAGGLRAGDAGLLADWLRLQQRDEYWSMSANNYELTIYIAAGLAGLLCFFLRRNEKEYLWFAANQILFAAEFALSDLTSAYSLPYGASTVVADILVWTAQLFLLEFVLRIVRGARGFLYWVAAASMAGAVLFELANWLRWVSAAVRNGGRAPILLIYGLCIVLMLAGGAKRGSSDAKLLLVPMGLLFLVAGLRLGMAGILTFGQVWIGVLLERLERVSSWPFPFGFTDLSLIVSEGAILCILLLRFVRTRRQEEKLSSEMEAARAVQHVLIPDEAPVVPGFMIESVYRPAGEVGGDFFQIVPNASGGALIVIGDVSGKGMPAAMTVSLLVGTFRTLAHYTQSPGEILAAMNQRMLSRSSGGFTTCLVIRIGPDGTAVAGDAGHLAPYVEGRELQLENGLPLGLSAKSTYVETVFTLPPGAQLTLLTDGVVEALSPARELFGFERTAAISTQSAEEIARAAQQFGQEDDITVLTLTFAPVEVAQ